MRNYIVLFSLLALACESDPDHITTLTGHDLGRPEWVAISVAEGRLQVPDGFFEVIFREAADLPDRYIEVVGLSNGYLVFSESYGGGYSDPKSNSHFRRLFDGQVFNKEPVVTEEWKPKRWGRVMFAEFIHTDMLCFALTKRLGMPLPMAVGGHEVNRAVLQGIFCDLEETDRFTGQAIEFAKELRVRE